MPEQLAAIDTPHAAHPGCFATAMLLAIVPLAAAGIADEFFVSAVTGSTGAGRTPRETTHHPVRQSNLFAYQALKHRHEPEVRALAKAAAGATSRCISCRIPGPLRAASTRRCSRKPRESARGAAGERGAHASTTAARRSCASRPEPPRVKDIAATNYAALHATVDGETIVVCSVLDNLVKGAAGGSIQWANRLLGLPETMGLTAPAAGWL